MGFVAIQIYMICAALLLLLLLLHSPSSSALISSTAAASPSPTPLPSHHEMQPQTPSAAPTTAQYQVFYIKNTTPFSLDKNQEPVKKHGKMRRHKRRSNKAKNFKTTAPFSVMLPKGFIPPSGSSPCHNDFPNSVAFFCQLSPTAVKP